MRVIVTRPAASAARTADKLVALGHQPILLPVSEAVHDFEAVKAALVLPHSAIAFTSAEAVRALDGIEIRRETQVFTVGEATAAAARAAGFQKVEAGPGDGERLAGMLAQRDIRHLLYLAGSPRSPGFERGLEKAGIPFQAIEAYRMVPTVWTPAQERSLRGMPDAVLVYSRETARQFFARALPLLPAGPAGSMHVLCLSPEIAGAIPEKDIITLHVADRPTEQALLVLLSSCSGTKIG